MKRDAASLVGQIVDELDPGTFVTKFVLVAEVIGTDGDRGVWVQCADEATTWDAIGLLQYALSLQTAAATDDGFGE